MTGEKETITALNVNRHCTLGMGRGRKQVKVSAGRRESGQKENMKI